MLSKVAWRNVWRNRTRSLVVILAIGLGVWAILFIISLTTGMAKTYVQTAIHDEISHIQIHAPEFLKDAGVLDTLFNSIELTKVISEKPEIESFTMRSVVGGMISSSKAVRGIKIRGIHPRQEAKLTGLNEHIEVGEYFGRKVRNPILISTEIADKLHAKLNSKLVLTFQNVQGEITAASFRVIGLFKTKNKRFDELNLFVQQSDLFKLLESPLYHEVALVVKEGQNIKTLKDELREQFAHLKVRDYKEISPNIDLYDSQIQVTTTIVMVIVMLALIFGIINTMLMAVLERLRELGMLMAIGMNKFRIFSMILLETLFLGLIGAPIGMLLGWLTISLTSRNGINLSSYSAGMREFGLSEILYPYIDQQVYWQLALAVLITALLGALYPAWKAIILKPAQAIRTI